jgi:hypothetical protein
MTYSRCSSFGCRDFATAIPKFLLEAWPCRESSRCALRHTTRLSLRSSAICSVAAASHHRVPTSCSRTTETGQPDSTPTLKRKQAGPGAVKRPEPGGAAVSKWRRDSRQPIMKRRWNTMNLKQGTYRTYRDCLQDGSLQRDLRRRIARTRTTPSCTAAWPLHRSGTKRRCSTSLSPPSPRLDSQPLLFSRRTLAALA